MRDKALGYLAEGGNAFIAVGGLHLPGKQGLVTLLREAGYTVTAVGVRALLRPSTQE